MFHTHLASVLSGYCISFTHMLQVFYLDVAYVSHICCNIMFQMFHLCPMYVTSKCFMLQVFHRGTVSDGRTAQAPGWGVAELGTGGQGRNELALAPGSRRHRERRGGHGEGAGHSGVGGQGARAR